MLKPRYAEEIVRKARALRATGYTLQSIADQLGISISTAFYWCSKGRRSYCGGPFCSTLNPADEGQPAGIGHKLSAAEFGDRAEKGES